MIKFIKRLLWLLLFLVAVALLLRVIFFKPPVIETVGNSAQKTVIDMHVHVAGLGYGDSGCFVSDVLQHSYKFDYYLSAFGVSGDEVIKQGDALIIKRISEMLGESKHVSSAIVLAMDGVVDDKGMLDKSKTQVYIPNNYLAKEVAKYPNLHFGASINPYRKDALQRLERAKQQGAKLIKWIPNIQLIDPSDKRIIPFYQKMKALDLPLLSHTGQERSFHDAMDQYGDPQRLALPLSLGVTVIAAHIATTGEVNQQSNYQRILPMFEKYPNLYTDLSSLTQINKLGFLKQALQEPRLKGRILYGTDYPLNNMVLSSAWYFPLQLTIKQMWQISHINNPWDRDIALKRALGMPDSLVADTNKMFH